MLPVVRELEAEYAGRLNVQIINYYADDTKPLLEQYGVRGHPSFVVLSRVGSPSPVLQGIVRRERLVDLIEASLA